MCGIFCSFDKDKLQELAALNSYRGQHSFSVAQFVPCDVHPRRDNGIALVCLRRSYGEFDLDAVDLGADGVYYVGHVQAPTTSDRSIGAIHPAVNRYDDLLWHNGIIKTFDVERLQQKQKSVTQWDTALLLAELTSPNFIDNLSDINGSFACIHFMANTLYVFRNEISPLFYDDDLNISSVKFQGSVPLPANMIFAIDIETRTIRNTNMKFTTKENPYYFEAQ